ncbi:MAG: DUF4401 domain-containing protein [Burkholderiales bacterium]
MTRDDLWARLVNAGLASGAAPAPSSAPSPWFVQALVAVGAWVASLFILVFLGGLVAGILRGSDASIAVGAILCILCAVAARVVSGNLFVEQIVTATALAGQALLGYGLLESHWRSPTHWLAFAAVEVLVVAAIPVHVHRALATIAAAYAMRFALVNAGIGVLFPPMVAASLAAAWRAAGRKIEADALWRPVIAGLALAGLLVVPAVLLDAFVWRARDPATGNAVLSWLATIALAAVLLAIVVRILRTTGASLRSRAATLALATSAAVALAARPVPGIVVALAVLLIAHAEGRRALMGLALAGLLGALVQHYYALDTTLLAKSAALLATGVVLLLAGFALRLGLAGEGAGRA